MAKNRAANGEWQLFSDSDSEAYQLDLLSFVTDHSPITIRQPERKLRTSSVKQNSEKIIGFHHYGILDKSKTFESFFAGNSNENTKNKIIKFISEHFNESNVLILNGHSGLGKTHLLHAIGNELTKLKKSYYLSSAFLVPSTVENFSIFNNYSYLLIDDLQEINDNLELQKIFCQLLDHAHQNKFKLIMTSSKEIKLLNGIDERLKSKLNSSVSEKMDYFDVQVIDDFIDLKLNNLNFNIDELTRNKIKTVCRPNGYLLEGILLQLKNGHQVEFNTNCNIDNNQFQTSLLDFEKEGIELIIKNVALDFQIPKDDIFTNSRDKKVVLARHVAMFILKDKVGLSLNQIGKLFFKDHTTVIYAVDKIRKQIQQNLEFKERILKLVF